MEMHMKIYLLAVVLPTLLGAGVRFFCRKFSQAWLITLSAALLTFAAWVIAQNPSVRGSEVYGLRTIWLMWFAIGSSLVGLLTFRKK